MHCLKMLLKIVKGIIRMDDEDFDRIIKGDSSWDLSSIAGVVVIFALVLVYLLN